MVKKTVFNHYNFIEELRIDRVIVSVGLKAGINDDQRLSWNQ